jgi:hypothetical protein
MAQVVKYLPTKHVTLLQMLVSSKMKRKKGRKEGRKEGRTNKGYDG